MRICTVVVTYNRYKLLKECLDALLNQTYSTDILLVDNASTDETSSFIISDGYLENNNLIYKRLNSNLGGAGGFCFGVEEALRLNYDAVWLMDDDAEPQLSTLEKLVETIRNNGNYSAYTCSTYIGTKENSTLSTFGHRGYFDYENPLPSFQKPIKKELYENRLLEIDMASFVGILIPISSIKKIGLPLKEFFIHHDDTEYSLRLSTIGKILMNTECKIFHKEQRKDEKIERNFFIFKKNRVKFEKLWLKYFGLRNSIFLTLKYGKGYKRYFDILFIYLQLVKDILLYDDNKFIRLNFATNSVLDGIRGIFDNDKPTKILKGK